LEHWTKICSDPFRSFEFLQNFFWWRNFYCQCQCQIFFGCSKVGKISLEETLALLFGSGGHTPWIRKEKDLRNNKFHFGSDIDGELKPSYKRINIISHKEKHH